MSRNVSWLLKTTSTEKDSFPVDDDLKLCAEEDCRTCSASRSCKKRRAKSESVKNSVDINAGYDEKGASNDYHQKDRIGEF